ncbi:class I SAM-dependent methyltransferase [Streptomyces sp. NPDC048248]|uniref:class I SAM-dependent methyltransferase n=1 Tax=Streptomyces sp. NPDC048248 TaxID=3365523 RepID=UPI003721095C
MTPFFLELVMSAGSVLDVGCGTGTLLHRARESGHRGRLCGLDPAAAMLTRARRRRDITWIHGDLSRLPRASSFDLIVMTGHAFQVLTEDEELRTALATIRHALRDGGRFVFETRNPLVRPWERWTPDRAVEVTNVEGVTARVAHEVELPVDGEVVRFSTTFGEPGADRPRVSRSRLRFLGADAIPRLLSDAGLTAAEQYGDWDRSPLTPDSPEIITVARPRPAP